MAVNLDGVFLMCRAVGRHMIGQKPDAVHDYWEKGAVQNRIGEPDELIGAVVYLASDAASFTTGEILTIDGGLTLR